MYASNWSPRAHVRYQVYACARIAGVDATRGSSYLFLSFFVSFFLLCIPVLKAQANNTWIKATAALINEPSRAAIPFVHNFNDFIFRLYCVNSLSLNSPYENLPGRLLPVYLFFLLGVWSQVRSQIQGCVLLMGWIFVKTTKIQPITTRATCTNLQDFTIRTISAFVSNSNSTLWRNA